MIVIAVIIIAIVGIILELRDAYSGANRKSGLEVLLELQEDFKDSNLMQWGNIFKNKVTQLGSSGFNKFKNLGVRPHDKSSLAVSRGYTKLREIMMATKIRPTGKVLSLCCGRGGWEQAYASIPDVTHITAITLGTIGGREGHEKFSEVYYPGKEKVNLKYADARTYPEVTHDTLLFDGGESSPNYEKEAKRFVELFDGCVMRQIRPSTKTFILKILTPTHPEVMDRLRKIQALTNKGSFYRPSICKNSTQEVYFVSTKPADLSREIRAILRGVVLRAIENRKLEKLKDGPTYHYVREEITPKPIKLLEPLDMTDSIAELGEALPEQGRDYNHWENKGVYPIGVEGSKGMKYNKYGMKCASRLIPTLKDFDEWKLTDTTPTGFLSVFNKKVDKAPTENHKYEKQLKLVYEGLTQHFRKRNFKLKELSWEEVAEQANKQGAPGYSDMKNNIFSVAEFLEQPDWIRQVEACRHALRRGKPIHALINTMAKREKKKAKTTMVGSRMIAYLGIAMRLLELKLFGNLLKLTKTDLNRFGVGGHGLHDIGERVRRVWKGLGVSDDIAGFDTRVGLYMLSLESKMTRDLGAGEDAELMYRVYAYPHILIPIPSVFRRVQLLAGRGQRMSGSQPTYAMNTISRLALFLLQYCVTAKIKDKDIVKVCLEIMSGKRDIGGCISGDDAFFTSKEDIDMLERCGEVLDEVGFYRKNVTPGMRSAISRTIEEIDFCSHHYEKITFYDSHRDKIVERYLPTRDVTEIVAKSLIRIGGKERELDDLAWLSAQGNNLLVNYPHLRSIRALGFSYKSIAPPNVILTDKGGFLRPTPWMQPGDVLEVLNRVYFGDSTLYPVEDFEVRSWRHVGYLNPKREIRYDPNTFSKKRSLWRDCLRMDVEQAIYEFTTGGDIRVLDNWRKHHLD